MMMKTTITFLMCIIYFASFAQTDFERTARSVPDKTAELKALYEQARQLEDNGSAAEINANILAVKNAWQEVDPEVAALYKPNETSEISSIFEDFASSETSEPRTSSRSPDDWEGSYLLRPEYTDGVDMEVTEDGDIYIGAYQNFIEHGQNADSIYVYRSTDGGNVFEEWKKTSVSEPVRKIQLISIDGGGDDFILAFVRAENGAFAVVRWNTQTGDVDAEGIALDVIDFSVDRNYPTSTDGQRVFATYVKNDNIIYSARSTAGSYGFDWADEISLGRYANQSAFAYGASGACYTGFIVSTNGNLLAMVNTDYNDPASWGPHKILEVGSSFELRNPSIRAARKPLAEDNVLVVAEARTGSANWLGFVYQRENQDDYIFHTIVGETDPGYNTTQFDTWVRRENGVDRIQLSYVHEPWDDDENNVSYSLQYNGYTFGNSDVVSDSWTNVWNSAPTAVAETPDGEPCMAFIGTSPGTPPYGQGLYFDSKSDMIGVEDNNIEGFSFYPNPAQDILNLTANETIEKVSVYSLLGQEVMEVSPEQKDMALEVSSLARGVYVMKVNVNGQIETYKIIKQ